MTLLFQNDVVVPLYAREKDTSPYTAFGFPDFATKHFYELNDGQKEIISKFYNCYLCDNLAFNLRVRILQCCIDSLVEGAVATCINAYPVLSYLDTDVKDYMIAAIAFNLLAEILKEYSIPVRVVPSAELLELEKICAVKTSVIYSMFKEKYYSLLKNEVHYFIKHEYLRLVIDAPLVALESALEYNPSFDEMKEVYYCCCDMLLNNCDISNLEGD